MRQHITYLQRARAVVRDQGWIALGHRLNVHLMRSLSRLTGNTAAGVYDVGYDRFLNAGQWTSQRLDEASVHIKSYTHPVRFSILIPVYRVDVDLLHTTIDSVCAQIYPHWELCLVDDASGDDAIRSALEDRKKADSRIRIHLSDENRGIAGATAIAMGMSGGDYLVMMDHDDVIDPRALYLAACELERDPALDLIYSDEDKLAPNGRRHSPFFKPGYSPELLESQNYFGHVVIVRKSIAEEAGGFRTGFDGAQDYDLWLRVTELTRRVGHIPSVLYSWREIPGSTAMGHQEKDYAWSAGLRALTDRYNRINTDSQITKGELPGTYSVRREIVNNPKISIVVPFRDRPELLDKCLHGVFESTQWKNIEVVAVDNGSVESRTVDILEKWRGQQSNIKVVKDSSDFNYSALCNRGVLASDGEFIVLLNNDIEIVSSDWIERMLSYAQRDEIGAVGVKLLYPNRSIQHAGIVIGINQSAGHPFKKFPASLNGYFCRLKIVSNVSAVTAAMMMVSRTKFDRAGGFDESDFGIGLNDVDFCLRLSSMGLRNVQINDCEAIHHESITRGSDFEGQNARRLEREQRSLRKKWAQLFESGDPYYNINLTLENEDYSLRQSLGNS
ncbi:MAG: glycosyltransferase [Pseudomonadota bacterium]